MSYDIKEYLTPTLMKTLKEFYKPPESPESFVTRLLIDTELQARFRLRFKTTIAEKLRESGSEVSSDDFEVKLNENGIYASYIGNEIDLKK